MFRKRPNLNTCYPLRQGVRFVHRNPNLFNIGDFLRSPRHYFTFLGVSCPTPIFSGSKRQEQRGRLLLNRRAFLREPRIRLLVEGDQGLWFEGMRGNRMLFGEDLQGLMRLQ